MSAFREQLLDRMIRIYGFEHKVVVAFAEACESTFLTDRALEVVVESHEETPWTSEE